MANPTAGDVHVNVPLTNISIAYLQKADVFVADKVFPIVPVQKQSDRYFVYSKDDWFRDEAEERAPSSESAGGGYNLDNTPSYYAKVYAHHKDIDDQIRQNADAPLNFDRDATEFVTQKLLLRREKVWTNSYFKAGVWGIDLAGVAAAPGANQFLQWDQVASTPIEDITNQKVAIAKKTGYKPTCMVVGPEVFAALKNHPDVIDRVKYTQKGVISQDMLAGLFEVERFLVPWAIINDAQEGAAANFNFVFGKACLLCYCAPQAGLLQPSAGYIFSWTGYFGASEQGLRIKRFRIETRESDRIEGEMAFDPKLIAPDLGAYFGAAVA